MATTPRTAERTAAAVEVAARFVASAGRSHPCGAGVNACVFHVGRRMSVSQSSASAGEAFDRGNGLKRGDMRADRSLALRAPSRGRKARTNDRTDENPSDSTNV